MRTNRLGAAVALVAAGALVLSACGTDQNVPRGQGGKVAQVDCGNKQQLTAEGSSAQHNAIGEFNAEYARACPGFSVSYNPTGSGSGVKQFTAGQVDFGGSDSPLEGSEVQKAAQRCHGNPAWHLPMVFGPVSLAYNVPGVDNVVLTPELTAKIFSGQIKQWNDPAIAAANPGKNLPNMKILVFYRSDESGTTDNFQKYLETAAGPAWGKGDGKSFKGGAGVGEGRAKSQGVTEAVKSTQGGITYVESSFAKNAGLQQAQLDNGAGPVKLNNETVGKAIDAAVVKGKGHDLELDLNSIYETKQPGAYPLVLVTYELVCSKGYSPETAKSLKAYLTTAATVGQDAAARVGYVPVPPELRSKLLNAINAIA